MKKRPDKIRIAVKMRVTMAMLTDNIRLQASDDGELTSESESKNVAMMNLVLLTK